MAKEERDESLAEELLEAHAGNFSTQLAVAIRFAFDEGLRRCEHGYADNHYNPSPWLSALSAILAPALLAAERQGYEAYQDKSLDAPGKGGNDGANVSA